MFASLNDIIDENQEKRSGMNACGTQLIETERLILRPFTYEDAGSMMTNWAGDDYVQKMYGEPSYKTLEAVNKLLSTRNTISVGP